MNEKRKVKLVKKLFGLFKRANIPRYLHRFGPKKYTSWFLLFIIVLQQKLKAGMKATLDILEDFGYNNLPHRTTLVKFLKRIPLWIWELILNVSINIKYSSIGLIDATGISRTVASDYYRERINSVNKIKEHLKLSLYADVESRKVLSIRLRARQAHDTKDVRYLVKKSKLLSETNIMDKGYDDNSIHSFFRERGVYSIIPVKKNARRGKYRKEMKRHFDYGLYLQRNAIEFIISSLKRTYGSYVRCKKIYGQRAEIYSRLILHNLKSLLLFRDFHICPLQNRKVYILVYIYNT